MTEIDTSLLAPFGRLASKRWFRWFALLTVIAVGVFDILKK